MSLIGDYLQGIQLMKQLEGWRVAIRYGMLPLVDYHRAVVLRRSLSDPIPTPKVDPETIIRIATREDLELCGEIIPAIRLKRFIQKFEAGEICIVAIRNGHAVGVGWAGFSHTETIQHTPLTLKPNEVYLWGAYVLPAYRARGIITAMAFYLLHHLKQLGYAHTYQITDVHHTPALKLAQRFSMTPVAYFTAFRLVGWRAARFEAIAQLQMTLVPVPEKDTHV